MSELWRSRALLIAFSNHPVLMPTLHHRRHCWWQVLVRLLVDRYLIRSQLQPCDLLPVMHSETGSLHSLLLSKRNSWWCIRWLLKISTIINHLFCIFLLGISSSKYLSILGFLCILALIIICSLYMFQINSISRTWSWLLVSISWLCILTLSHLIDIFIKLKSYLWIVLFTWTLRLILIFLHIVHIFNINFIFL